MARSPGKLEVKKWWPHWSGDTLDNVIDYTTFVMIPAFILYQSGLLDHTNAIGQKEELISKFTSFSAAAVIVITSAIYYADTRMKTEDYGFKGFPVCWNMVVFALFVGFAVTDILAGIHPVHGTHDIFSHHIHPSGTRKSAPPLEHLCVCDLGDQRIDLLSISILIIRYSSMPSSSPAVFICFVSVLFCN